MDSFANTDALGCALQSYYSGEISQELKVLSDISEEDIIPLAYLFRGIEDMPLLETKALSLCKGKVLDVGAGSGCHSLILKENSIDVKTIDISEGAVDVMQKRGLHAENINFFDVNEKYDTLLFLMNGVGISGTLKGLSSFLLKSKSLLQPNGQILLDSSDIHYMFEDEDGSVLIDLNSSYYGEVIYQMQYGSVKTKPFDWLFVDFATLKSVAFNLGFNVELVLEDDSHQYLAKLWL